MSLPPLPSSELTDPNDEITLPRLIEALQNRQRIRQMMIEEYNRAGFYSQLVSYKPSILFFWAHLPHLMILASRMKSMLQELDSTLSSKENLIHEHNGRLTEKDKVIQTNKTEIERLEKRNKMQEHKVHLELILLLLVLYFCFCFLKVSHDCSRSTSCRKQQKSTRMTSAPCSRSWRPGGIGCRESFLRRDAWSSACRAWSQTRSISGRKNA